MNESRTEWVEFCRFRCGPYMLPTCTIVTDFVTLAPELTRYRTLFPGTGSSEIVIEQVPLREEFTFYNERVLLEQSQDRASFVLYMLDIIDHDPADTSYHAIDTCILTPNVFACPAESSEFRDIPPFLRAKGSDGTK